MRDIRKLDITKYYIPELNDLCEGFEFELQKYNEGTDEYIDSWIKHKFDVRSGLGHDDYHTFNDDRVRVEYLTKEQIEEEGWEEKELRSTIDNYVYFVNKQRKLIGYDFHKKRLNVIDTINSYHGKCRCINDFRKIIKLLGI